MAQPCQDMAGLVFPEIRGRKFHFLTRAKTRNKKSENEQKKLDKARRSSKEGPSQCKQTKAGRTRYTHPYAKNKEKWSMLPCVGG